MSGSGTRCAACRYSRRRCGEDCFLAPYFPPTQPERFSGVHRIFGASNVSRMLQQLPPLLRPEAADAISSEASWRIHSPVYGCVGVISMLQQEIHRVQLEIAETQAQIAMHIAQLQFQQQQQQTVEATYFSGQLIMNEQFDSDMPFPDSHQRPSLLH